MRVACAGVLPLLLACRPDPEPPCQAAATCDTGAPDTDADADTDSDSDADTDTDSDADTDTDSDADTDTADTDTDTETDTGGDTDPDEPFVLSCDTGVVATEPCTVAADGSGTYTTIQDAVDAASEGDVITVCPGYYDSVLIDMVGVTLVGYGADSTCIIGASAAGITIDGVDVDISGFTVSGDASDPAAIDVILASGTLHDLRVAGVEPGSAGNRHAAYVYYSEMIWEDVRFEHNVVDVALAVTGGTNTIRHSTWDHNVAGIVSYNMLGGSLEVTNCAFIANSDQAVHSSDTNGTMTNNIFYDNVLGLAVIDSSVGSLVVRNNVALSNWSGFSGSDPDTDYNVAWNNTFSNFSGYMGTHDMITDPSFEDPAGGDFRLQPSSPLIDAGDPDPAFDDADGSPNDIGIFGGPYGNWTPS